MWESSMVIFQMSGSLRVLSRGGHAGVANAGADGVEDVPLGVVGRIGD